MDLSMARRSMMSDVVKISEMPFGKSFDDYPEGTLFELDEGDEEDWEEDLKEE